MDIVLQTLMEWGRHVLDFFNALPPEYWPVIIATIPVSALLVIGKIAIKRKWDKAPSETKMFLINFGTIVGMAVAAYLSTTPTSDPVDGIFSMVGLGLLVQQPVYFRFIKPIIRLAFENYDAGKALNEEMKSAAVPENGTPIEQVK